MKQENLFKKLGPILNELCDQYEFLSKNPSDINDLELELFLANVYFLSDHIQIIKKLNARNESQAFKQVSNKAPTVQSETLAPQPDTKPKTVVEEIIQAKPAIISTQENKETAKEKMVEKAVIKKTDEETVEEGLFKFESASSTFEFVLDKEADSNKFNPEENKATDKATDKSLIEEKQRILEQKQKLREKQTSIPLVYEEDEIGPEPFLMSLPKQNDNNRTPDDYKLAESEKSEVIKTNKPTLNDMHANKNNAPNVNLSSSTAIKDLKQAISLNDKLLYIKDLFNGYNLAYAEAIDLANKLPNFEAADTFFQKNYAAKNNWVNKQATVDKFYKLLNQRFKT